MSKILAKSKSNISLCEHTKGLFKQLRDLITLNSKLAEKLNCYLLETAIALHDIGKVSPSFQISIGNWDYSPRIPFPDIPHSVFSIFWINKEKLTQKFDSEENIRILLSAVAFHHWRDNFQNILLGTDKELKRALMVLRENVEFRERLLENIKSELNCDGLNEFLELINFDEELADFVENGGKLFNYVTPPYHSYFLPLRVALSEDYKRKWIFTAGVLLRVDHFASYIQEEGIVGEIDRPAPPYSKVENQIRQEIRRKTGRNQEPWQIESLRDKRDRNIILVAPTGSGKTEFAYLWGAEDKIFFTLPLKSAVNATFDRACDVFGSENVGLLHSDADVYLFEKNSNYEGERFRVLDFAKQLSFPVLVSTGDQVFPAALKYPGYEKIYATLGYSKLVIDEVQSYDPQAAAIIVKLIEDMVKIGGNFLLMTATLPKFVKDEIEERVGKDSFVYLDLYSADEYTKICKHKVEIRCEDITQRIDEILDKAGKGLRILVILNTVEKAQEVYERLCKRKGSLYLSLIHSRFTLEDRRRLEEEIVGMVKDKRIPGTFSNPKPDDEIAGKILVATQVVEASLDIDADILYTELAPIDSLVQRMGRVLRRVRDRKTYEKYLDNREPKEPNVFIFYQKPDNEIKLCSGAGSVYPVDLLVFSLAVVGEKILDKSLDGLLNQYLLDAEKRKKSKNYTNRDRLKSFLNALLDQLNKIEDKIFCLSEIEKKEMVESLYQKMPKHSNYFQRFYETLEILDAGYMSERKHEAQRIFREIYSVPAIVESKLDEFKKFLEDFAKKDDFNYTRFKIDVLSKCVVNIDVRRYFSDNRLQLRDVSYIVYELKEVDDWKAKKLKKWLRDIYIFEGEYSSDKGVSFKDEKKK